MEKVIKSTIDNPDLFINGKRVYATRVTAQREVEESHFETLESSPYKTPEPIPKIEVELFGSDSHMFNAMQQLYDALQAVYLRGDYPLHTKLGKKIARALDNADGEQSRRDLWPHIRPRA